MSNAPAEYDPRYLAGVQAFNDGDFFEAHEAWEDLWSEATGPARRFYQGMIHAAVGLCHLTNGNLRGAAKLYRSCIDYLAPCGERFLGVDLARFRVELERCFHEVLAPEGPPAGTTLDESLVPLLELQPPPESWPEHKGLP